MYPQKHVLLVDSNSRYISQLGSHLQAEGFAIHIARDVFTAQAMVKQSQIHIAVVSVQLLNEHDSRDVSGIELAARLQLYTRVIMVAEQPTFEMTRLALAQRTNGPAPACDFVARNEGTAAVITAIRKVLKLTINTPTQPNRSIKPQREDQWHTRSTKRFGLDHYTRTALVDGHSVTLTEREYRLLRFFFDRAESVITREDIVCQVLSEIYDPFADCNRVNNIISRLRRRVEPEPKTPQFLVTRWGSGWIFLPEGDETA